VNRLWLADAAKSIQLAGETQIRGLPSAPASGVDDGHVGGEIRAACVEWVDVLELGCEIAVRVEGDGSLADETDLALATVCLEHHVAPLLGRERVEVERVHRSP
jgi:hypothetical protein